MFEVAYEKGILRYEDSRLMVNGECIAEYQKTTGKKWYWGMRHEKLISEFYHSGKHVSVKDVKPAMDLLFGVYKSAKTNQPVNVK